MFVWGPPAGYSDIEIYSMSLPGEILHLTSYMFQGPAFLGPTRGQVSLMKARRQPDINSEMVVAIKSVGWGFGPLEPCTCRITCDVTTPTAIPLVITVQ